MGKKATFYLVAALLARAAWAVEGNVDVAVQSKYIWRGMVVSDKPVLQTGVSVSGKGFAAQIWGNIDLTDVNGAKNVVSEIDYWLSYTTSVKNVDLTLTIYDYTYPHCADPSTQEIWFGATFKTIFSPSITVVRDVNLVKGFYVLLTASQDLALFRSSYSTGVVLSLNLGNGDKQYRRGYFPENRTGRVTDYGIRLDWPVKLGWGELNLNVQYSNFYESDLHLLDHESTKANFIAGATYSLQF